MPKPFRVTIPAAVALALAASTLSAAPASAADKTISAKTDSAICDDRAKWSFYLSGVGENDGGIEPPAQIEAELKNGGTVTIPMVTPFEYVAHYEVPATTELTGNATAEIDEAWEGGTGDFLLESGPCPNRTAMAVGATSPLVVKGATATVTGRLTRPDGTVLAGRRVRVRLHSVDATGKGKEYGPLTTGADGRFTLKATAESFGPLSYTAEYYGSGPLDFAETGASERTVVMSVPATPPAGAGRLASSAGASLAAGGRTTLSGSGYTPDSEIGIVAYSTPRLLGTARTDAAGRFSTEVTVPADLTGAHTLVAVGGGADAIRYLTLPVTVGPATAGQGAALPVTGAPVWLGALLGGVLVAGGVALWLLARRRRPRFSAL